MTAHPQNTRMFTRSLDALDHAERKRRLAVRCEDIARRMTTWAKAFRAEADELDPPSTWINAPVRGSHEGHE